MKSLSTLTIVSAMSLSVLIAADSAPSDDALRQQVVSHEREGLEALKTGDLERFGNLTAGEAILVDAQGPATKTQLLSNVAGFRLTDYSMDDVKFLRLSPNTGLITYKITEKGASHGHEFSAQAWVSSIWTERDGKWVCLFSQETAVRRPPPGG